jgi:hypothetical protein
MSKPTNPTTYIDSLLSNAVSAHLATLPEWESVGVFTGESDAQRTVPCVICYAGSAQVPAGLPLFCRNYDVQAVVTIESKADAQAGDATLVAGLAKHRDLVQDVMNCLRNTTAITAQVAADGHKLYEIYPTSQQPNLQDENRCFRTDIDISLCIVLDLPTVG